MLYESFNKFGDTSLRYNSQIVAYSMIIEWIISKDVFRTLDEWTHEYIKWCSEEKIYDYKKNKKGLNRFKIAISILINKIPILQKELSNDCNVEKEKYSFRNENVKNNWENLSYEKFFFLYMQVGEKNVNKSFLELLNFLKNNTYKTNSKLIAICFMVWNGDERFEDLYELGIDCIIEKITTIKLNSIFDNKKIHFDNITCSNLFKKPPKVEKEIEKIIECKQKGIDLSLDFFSLYDHRKDNYIWKIFSKKYEKFNLTILINKLNKISLKEFIFEIVRIQNINNLQKEYLDLLNRWLHNFDISNSSSTLNFLYDYKKIGNLINFDNKDVYELSDNQDKKIIFPYTKEEVIFFLEKIACKDFKFKDSDDSLKMIGNSIIAEYFVNLFFCFKYNINPEDFKLYVNTKVTKQLLPVYTAPGKMSDMCYFDDKVVHNIETTILRTKLDIEKNEIFPCLNHLKESKEKYDKLGVKKILLTFISYVEENEIDKRFSHNFQDEFKDSKMNKLNIRKFNALNFIKK